MSGRIIEATEVRQWFGSRSKPWLDETFLQEVSSQLTERLSLNFSQDLDPGPEFVEDDSYGEWWDFMASAKAADELLGSLPRMIAFWQKQRWSPEGRAGCEAIERLYAAMTAAHPYVKHPLGELVAPAVNVKASKDWHLPAVIVAGIVATAVVSRGGNPPAYSRGSLLVRVVRKALTRVGYKSIGNVEDAGIGAFLKRWHCQFGIPGLKLSSEQEAIVAEWDARFDQRQNG